MQIAQFHLDEAGSASLAAQIAKQAIKGDIFGLSGDLGAGKSSFARSFLRACGVLEDIPSPSFTLVQTYETPLFPVWHADLYRLSAHQEVEPLGLWHQADQRITLIEWPERLSQADFSRLILLRFDFLDDPAQRKITILASPNLANRFRFSLE